MTSNFGNEHSTDHAKSSRTMLLEIDLDVIIEVDPKNNS